MPSIRMKHLSLYSMNDWEVRTFGGAYTIRDPKGNGCVAERVRVISPDEIAIVHPLLPDITINTRKIKSLPISCRGDLTDEKVIKSMREVYVDEPEYPVHRFSQAFRRDRLQHSLAQYHGDNTPD